MKFKVKSENTPNWYTARRLAERVYGYKTLVEEGTGRILGAHIVGPQADEPAQGIPVPRIKFARVLLHHHFRGSGELIDSSTGRLARLQWLHSSHQGSRRVPRHNGRRKIKCNTNVELAVDAIQHPTWFRQDLEHLLTLLVNGAIHLRVAERISFEEVPEAHGCLEAGDLEGKLVLCPDLRSRSEQRST